MEVSKTQMQVESLARLDAGKFWKIENAFYFPDDKERIRLARTLKCAESDLPTEQSEEARAAS